MKQPLLNNLTYIFVGGDSSVHSRDDFIDSDDADDDDEDDMSTYGGHLVNDCLKCQLIASSVARFGEILPFWHKFKLKWQYLEGLFSIWHNFGSTLANYVCFWTNVY